MMRGCVWRRSWLRIGGQGEREPEGRALPLDALDPDLPMMQFDDLLADMQAKAEARGLGGGALNVDAWRAMKHLPHPALFCPGETRPLVLHRDDRLACIDLKADGDDARIWRILDRIRQI